MDVKVPADVMEAAVVAALTTDENHVMRELVRTALTEPVDTGYRGGRATKKTMLEEIVEQATRDLVRVLVRRFIEDYEDEVLAIVREEFDDAAFRKAAKKAVSEMLDKGLYSNL